MSTRCRGGEGERGIIVLERGLEYLEERVRVPGSGDYDRARGVRVPGKSGMNIREKDYSTRERGVGWPGKG